MKKRGFTLVELLAVIAILAILIIIVLPNVMEQFNQSKQNSFENEVKQIFKSTQQNWTEDYLTSTGNLVYARSTEKCAKELDLNGRTNVNYYVEVDKYGNIIKLFATDGSYQYEYRGEALKIEEIGNSKQVANLQSKDILSITCTGAKKNGMYVTSSDVIDGTNSAKDCSNNDVVNTIPSNATGLYKIMAEASFLDNAKSEYVTSCSGINFNTISSDTNGKGIYEIASTKDDVYPIYYYRGAVTNNNVKFGGFCWKAVRTTSTGGVKLIYNGSPDASGHCTNTTGLSTQIGTSVFNESYTSPASIGYMYGKFYTYSNKTLDATNAGYKFGESVTYSGGTYKLTNPIEVTESNYNQPTYFNNNHYTCFSTSDTCTKVYYVYYIGGSKYWHITITGVDPSGRELIDVVKESMFRNDTDSEAKIEVEKWYRDNMTSYTSKLEDTIYCNDRSTTLLSGWNPNGNMKNYLYFSGQTRAWTMHKPSLACERADDKFTVSSSNGNGKLKYPVGLITSDEIMYAGGRNATYNESYYLNTENNYWALTPSYFNTYFTDQISMRPQGRLSGNVANNSFGLRPIISISQNTSVISGDGTSNNPYVIE